MAADLTDLGAAVSAFANLNLNGADEAASLSQFSSVLFDLTRCITEAIPRHEREAILAAVAPARLRLAEVPLYHRCQTWPRGFPGDFETVEQMLGPTKCQPGTYPYYAETFFRLSVPVQQHRNKLVHQALQIVDAWSRHGSETRILVLACGGCADVRMILPTLAVRPPHLALVDFDPGALEFARQQLAPIASNCRFIQGNVVRAVAGLGTEQYHLVLAGGLFDYLSDAVIATLLRRICQQHLVPGGKIVFTNFSDHNLYRAWMYYLINWTLIERSREQLVDLCTRSGIEEGAVTIFKETTGLTYIVEVEGRTG